MLVYLPMIMVGYHDGHVREYAAGWRSLPPELGEFWCELDLVAWRYRHPEKLPPYFVNPGKVELTQKPPHLRAFFRMAATAPEPPDRNVITVDRNVYPLPGDEEARERQGSVGAGGTGGTSTFHVSYTTSAPPVDTSRCSALVDLIIGTEERINAQRAALGYGAIPVNRRIRGEEDHHLFMNRVNAAMANPDPKRDPHDWVRFVLVRRSGQPESVVPLDDEGQPRGFSIPIDPERHAGNLHERAEGSVYP